MTCQDCDLLQLLPVTLHNAATTDYTGIRTMSSIVLAYQ